MYAVSSENAHDVGEPRLDIWEQFVVNSATFSLEPTLRTKDEIVKTVLIAIVGCFFSEIFEIYPSGGSPNTVCSTTAARLGVK